jgi:hypothetical protein
MQVKKIYKQVQLNVMGFKAQCTNACYMVKFSVQITWFLADQANLMMWLIVRVEIQLLLKLLAGLSMDKAG